MRIGVIGLGRAGTNMAKLFVDQGHEVIAYDTQAIRMTDLPKSLVHTPVTVLDHTLLSCDYVVLAVQDDPLVKVALDLESRYPVKTFVFLSGSRSCQDFTGAGLKARVIGLHPIRAFASFDDSIESFDTCYFGFEGTQDDLKEIKALLPRISPRLVRVKTKDKALYHGSAVMASNFVVTLLAEAQSHYMTMGIDPDKAQAIVLSLAQSALNNIQRVGLKNAQTGPLVRGDVATVDKHVTALSKEAGTYKTLSNLTLKHFGDQLKEVTLETLKEHLKG